MRIRIIIVCIGILVAATACEDILEVVDISNENVSVLAPVTGSILNDNDIRFSWEGVAEATAYKIQVATPDFSTANQIALDSIIVVDSLGNIKTNIRSTLTNGSYEWRIKALNSDYETPFSNNTFTIQGEEDIVPPNTPELVAPANDSAQEETMVNFSWTREDIIGTAERDSIYIYTDENLQSLNMKALGANKAFTTTLESGMYYWVVQAFDVAGNTSDDSETFKVTIN